MATTFLQVAPYLALLAMLCWAAAEDFRSRRIRNWLTFAMILSGLAQSFTAVRTVSPLDSLLGFLTGAALLIVPFALGAIGGGDVKLLAGVGAWLGAKMTFEVFVVEAVIGLVIVLVQASATGQLSVLFRNSGVLAVNLLHARDVGLDHVQETGRSCRSIARPLPYAVPILAATVFVLYVSLRGGHL